jgi:LacI family transcriptional regulator
MSKRHADRRTTLADVAARAGTSRATASRALAGDQRISEATRRAVRDAAEALEYIPNVAARGLRARRTRTLGFLLPDLGDPVHGQVAAGFELEAAGSGYTVIMVAARNVLANERRALRVFVERSTDGICIVSCILDPSEARDRAGPSPLVVVQPDHPRLASRPLRLDGVIRSDDASGVRQAVDHLLATGYRDIAYLGMGRTGSNTVRRATAQRVLWEAAGIRLRAFQVGADAWRAPSLLGEALGSTLPEAVICYDDKLALALLDGLRERGARVPDDTAVVGFDGIPFAAIARPRLTTVMTPATEMGRRAARTLVDAIVTGRMAPAMTLPVELVVRESTARATASGRPMADLVASDGR